jgi:hypothetical protein
LKRSIIVNHAAPLEFHPWTNRIGFRTGAERTVVRGSGPETESGEQAAKERIAADANTERRKTLLRLMLDT